MIATMPATSCLKGFKGGFRGKGKASQGWLEGGLRRGLKGGLRKSFKGDLRRGDLKFLKGASRGLPSL